MAFLAAFISIFTFKSGQSNCTWVRLFFQSLLVAIVNAMGYCMKDQMKLDVTLLNFANALDKVYY